MQNVFKQYDFVLDPDDNECLVVDTGVWDNVGSVDTVWCRRISDLFERPRDIAPDQREYEFLTPEEMRDLIQSERDDCAEYNQSELTFVGRRDMDPDVGDIIRTKDSDDNEIYGMICHKGHLDVEDDRYSDRRLYMDYWCIMADSPESAANKFNTMSQQDFLLKFTMDANDEYVHEGDIEGIKHSGSPDVVAFAPVLYPGDTVRIIYPVSESMLTGPTNATSNPYVGMYGLILKRWSKFESEKALDDMPDEMAHDFNMHVDSFVYAIRVIGPEITKRIDDYWLDFDALSDSEKFENDEIIFYNPNSDAGSDVIKIPYALMYRSSIHIGDLIKTDTDDYGIVIHGPGRLDMKVDGNPVDIGNEDDLYVMLDTTMDRVVTAVNDAGWDDFIPHISGNADISATSNVIALPNRQPDVELVARGDDINVGDIVRMIYVPGWDTDGEHGTPDCPRALGHFGIVVRKWERGQPWSQIDKYRTQNGKRELFGEDDFDIKSGDYYFIKYIGPVFPGVRPESLLDKFGEMSDTDRFEGYVDDMNMRYFMAIQYNNDRIPHIIKVPVKYYIPDSILDVEPKESITDFGYTVMTSGTRAMRFDVPTSEELERKRAEAALKENELKQALIKRYTAEAMERQQAVEDWYSGIPYEKDIYDMIDEDGTIPDVRIQRKTLIDPDFLERIKRSKERHLSIRPSKS